MEPVTDKLEKWVSMYNRVIREWLNRELRDFDDLNESNYYYILIVCEHPGLAQSELIQYIYREQSIVTKAVRYLVSKGWIEMTKDPADRRRSVVSPTQKAHDAYPKLKRIASQANAFATEGLEPDEARQLESLLKKALLPLPGIDKFWLA
ncbi:MarR family winged helix-turn-helix transcriptional regulator [Lacticaseibacillus saniviri]|nr:MarR family transcriptional regulator [Lacticaseibacillus saniviri]MCG4282069.1 MarR family transcriptional regulator [Lacticaseibacillus saniviri]